MEDVKQQYTSTFQLLSAEADGDLKNMIDGLTGDTRAKMAGFVDKVTLQEIINFYDSYMNLKGNVVIIISK